MENFEEKRQEYFKRLKEHEELVVELSENEENKKGLEILLLPKNEEELNLANAYLMFIQDFKNILCGNVEEIDFNNCILMDYMSIMVKLGYNNSSEEELEKVLKNNWDIDSVAQISYELIVLAINGPENYADIIKERCNIDINNELDSLRLSLLISKANEKIQEYRPDLQPINEKSMDIFINFADKFHELCENSIKKNSNSEVSDMNSFKQKRL